MSIITKYRAAVLVLLLSLTASHLSAYKWGFNAARLEQSEQTNKSLARAAQHIIDEQAKLQQVEDIIYKSPSQNIKSPVLMRSLVRLPECSGKAHCPPP